MKKARILLAIGIVTMTFFGACKKSANVQQETGTQQNSNKILTVSGAELNAIFAQSRSVHNGLLAQEFIAINNDQVATVPQLQAFSNNYFLNVPYSSTAVNSMSDNFYSMYGSAGFDANLASTINSNNNVKELFQWLGTVVNSTSSLMPVAQFQQIINGKLSSISANASMPDGDKQICAAVLGIAAGSYEYWSNNIDGWYQMMAAKGQTSTQSKGGKVKDLFIDDCRGGSWGGLIGSFLPGVGNVAGAIMGGAILSAATALSWD